MVEWRSGVVEQCCEVVWWGGGVRIVEWWCGRYDHTVERKSHLPLLPCELVGGTTIRSCFSSLCAVLWCHRRLIS